MKIVQALLFGLLILSSCKDKQDLRTKAVNIDSTYFKKYPGIVSKIDKRIELPNDYYYKFVQVSKKKCKIEWGNGLFKNITSGDYHFLVCDSIRAGGQNNNFVILKATITSQGWLYICLPLKKEKTEIVIENPILFQSDKNIVVSDGFRKDTVLLINNLASGEIQPIIESVELCHPYFHNCLDTLFISGENLQYTFRFDLDKEKDKRRVSRKIGIRI